jgi:hypothetical protein
MLLNPTRLLLWCIGGSVLVHLALASAKSTAAQAAFSPAFSYLLGYDVHGNITLLVIAVAAFALRRHPLPLNAVQSIGAQPWLLAAAIFPLLCLGALRAYHDYPLSMDEYSSVFQAKIFATGRITGAFPPELVDRLIPVFLQNHFFTVSRTTGEVSSTYWPGFALLLAPFTWLGIPWAANPALGALSIPMLYRLSREATGSAEAASWAVALMVASPVFVVASISYYSMQAHLLANLLYALLLLRPTLPRALAAGVIGSFALTLHNPVPHLLFASGFVLWLAFRVRSARALLALAVGYVPLSLVLGFGWRQHLGALMSAAPSAPAVAAAQAPKLFEAAWSAFGNIVSLPDWRTLHARLLGTAKLWSWGVAGALVLAAYGYGALRARPSARVLAAALVVTFFGYFLVRFDQGHGWGYRYLHPAWFIVPLFGGMVLAPVARRDGDELRTMAAWAVVLSLVLANGLRLIQVDSYIVHHRAQVPPLALPADPARQEVLFIDIARGFYTHDMVQNDPYLRGPRIIMVGGGGAGQSELMAKRFPGYVLTARGGWGELWSRPPGAR